MWHYPCFYPQGWLAFVTYLTIFTICNKSTCAADLQHLSVLNFLPIFSLFLRIIFLLSLSFMYNTGKNSFMTSKGSSWVILSRATPTSYLCRNLQLSDFITLLLLPLKSKLSERQIFVRVLHCYIP